MSENNATHAMRAPTGTLLNGRYRLDEQVGIGGMARVYRAFDTVLERQVAVKTLNREVASDSDPLERFRREARAVARLSHPHIVTVIDAGEDDGTPYIVFEYIEGETLKQRIRRLGRLDVAEAVAYAIELARALGAAHEAGIVHRDVKPQNVMIDGDGRALITDFGIARTLAEEGLTVDGRVLGTTDYVSPEQALGKSVTGQSDIYALGVVLFEMLTGEVPFSAENQVAVAMKHVREELPDVQQRRPEVSAGLAAVIDRATAKDVRRRYPDATAMIDDLSEALAIEAVRTGHATGQATSVLRTLPRSTTRRLPLRLRNPQRMTLTLVVLGLGAVIAAVILIGQTHRGIGAPANVSPPAALRVVHLAQNAAHDYNPYGTPEHVGQIQNVDDGDPNTFWSTFSYNGGQLGKPGTGVYVDAAPTVHAGAIVLQTSTPGFVAQVWASNSATDPSSAQSSPASGSLGTLGWTRVDTGDRTVASKAQINLETGGRSFRYYLAWITQLPPGRQSAAINELTLYRCAAAHCSASAPAAAPKTQGATGAFGLGTTGG
ncbi:MAG: eukaryotic-like serine/threonine-protein kinase [Solirubrobacteraceae bacterium]|jgi:serine/threonine-protein kinase|nr:eukaryotic-like serine/threonine-protein kinase [Solirubrobacteraceae bacterium]